MAIVDEISSDNGAEGLRWRVPADPNLNMSHVPRGTRRYYGDSSIAAKAAGDEVRVEINFNFPPGFVYVLKELSLTISSSTQTMNYGDVGECILFLGNYQPRYQLSNLGTAYAGAALNARRTYELYGGPSRAFIDGNQGQSLSLRVSDIDASNSPSADVFWNGEFYEYDVQQCLEYPINSPLPTLAM